LQQYVAVYRKVKIRARRAGGRVRALECLRGNIISEPADASLAARTTSP
jgi:hypothetical protein